MDETIKASINKPHCEFDAKGKKIMPIDHQSEKRSLVPRYHQKLGILPKPDLSKKRATR